MEDKYTKWVAAWGNATSIIDQTECTYSKNITLRYPIRICFNGSKLRLHFSNISGTEAVTLSKVNVAVSNGEKEIDTLSSRLVLFDGNIQGIIPPGEELVSDEINFEVTAGMDIAVSIYLDDYTQMNSGVLITGPLSKGYYSYGDFFEEKTLPLNKTRKTKWFYFLNTVDILTENDNHALICYGDSITAQSWPDYLAIRAWNEGYRNISIIRRAISGTRILREYDCITYAAYGIKGEKRFKREIDVAGADRLIIQHGINDIIHPVGAEVNPFRPWEDLPSLEELENGVNEIYVKPALEKNLKVYLGTLLPIYGWRTYEDFREKLKNDFNDFLRNNNMVDGVVDFDLAVRDADDTRKFAEGFDSGDHLHPSEAAYKAMADAVPAEILK